METCSGIALQKKVIIWHIYTDLHAQLFWDSESRNTNLHVGPRSLHGKIQMSAVWDKICGQNPQIWDKGSVQMLHPGLYPRLRLNIDTCIITPQKW